MDYLGIIINGYFNKNNRDFLDKYFYREFKKAEKEHYEVGEFFSGCTDIIKSWEKSLEQEKFKRKSELWRMLAMAKNKTMPYADMQGKTIEQKRKETIEYCKSELKDERHDGIGSLSFTAHLVSLTNGRVAYNMDYNEIVIIKKGMAKAKLKVLSEKVTELINNLPDKQETTKQKPQPTATKNQINLPEKKEKTLSKKIKCHFNFFKGNCPRGHKQILLDDDFDKLINWTIYYFENEFQVPEITEPIKKVNTNTTFVRLAFKYLFKEIHQQKTYPKTLFKFYSKAFKPYADEKKENFYKVKNNDIVKELMKID
jgi:hypothetical protein